LSYKYFSNTKCEYFPCHGDDKQNCLFCYCPLYFFEDCGGDPKFVKNIKDCSGCDKNHGKDSFEFIQFRLKSAFSKLGNELNFIKLGD